LSAEARLRAKADATKQSSFANPVMDCFAQLVIGRRFMPTRWLAMTFAGPGSSPDEALERPSLFPTTMPIFDLT
jgi:hypothetical protein